MKKELIDIYENSQILGVSPKKPSNIFKYHFIEGAFLEVLGPDNREYNVVFIDQDKNEIVHESVISNNMWTRANKKYFINWLIKVYDKHTGNLEFEHSYDAREKRVYIHIDSKSIGDTLAWFPYIEEFRKKHQCEVICSSFRNSWFKSTYKEIEFVEPSSIVENLYAMYSIGWFYNGKNIDLDKNVAEVKTQPLAKTSSDILGLDYIEVKPKLHFNKKPKPIKQKYVVIAPHASAHAKYWNHPKGWQQVIDWLKEQKYKVVMITQEKLGDTWHDSKLGGKLENVVDKTGNFSLEDRMSDIYHAEAFIGVGSGLSWLSWALNQKTILISGFSEPYTEFKDCKRISTPKGVCTGCFNREWLDPGDWEWCPDHKNTFRQFECTKSITPEVVINSLKETLNIY